MPTNLRIQVAFLACLTVIGCSDEEPLAVRTPSSAPLSLELSSTVALPGDTVAAALRFGSSEARYGVIQGQLSFNPAALRYLGQDLGAPGLVAVNSTSSDAGMLPLLAVDATGLPLRPVVLAFEVLDHDYARSVRFEATLLAGLDLSIAKVMSVSGALALEPLPMPAMLRRVQPAELAQLRYPQLTSRDSVPRVPGQYRPNLRYGDATLDGAINGLDLVYLAGVAVGSQPAISGTSSPSRDAVVAGNVYPANLPGLGEGGDPLPPGLEPTGLRLINGLDVLALAFASIGRAQPAIGELIPGRDRVASARVLVTGGIATDRTWSSDTVYEIVNNLHVINGATLTIQPGTRIEARAGAGKIIISRDGRVVADGTPLQPIVFTCANPIPTNNCWYGLVVLGYAPVVQGSFEGGPAGRGQSGTGCAQADWYLRYGGCTPADSSGVLRYVRIEHAVDGLVLGGVGSRTVIDYIQTGPSSNSPLLVFGGTADLRHIVLSPGGGQSPFVNFYNNWQGRVQFLLGLGAGIASDQSGIRVRNATLIPASQAIVSDGMIEAANVLTIGGPLFAPAVSCNNPTLRFSIMAVLADTSNHAVRCSAGSALLDPARSNRMILDPDSSMALLIDPFDPVAPDARPGVASLIASMRTPALSGDGFYDTSATYIGAVAPSGGAGVAIPWYAGWTAPAAAH